MQGSGDFLEYANQFVHLRGPLFYSEGREYRFIVSWYAEADFFELVLEQLGRCVVVRRDPTKVNRQPFVSADSKKRFGAELQENGAE